MVVITTHPMKKQSTYSGDSEREKKKKSWRGTKRLFRNNSVEVEDEDSWDFGTIKQAPPQIQKPSLQMHHSPSQYSTTNGFTNEKYQSSSPSQSPSNHQLPRTVSKNQVNPQPQHQSPPTTTTSRVNELTVSVKRKRGKRLRI